MSGVDESSPAFRVAYPGSNTDPGENFSLKFDNIGLTRVLV